MYRFRFGIVIAADVTVYVVASGTGPVLVVADVDSLVIWLLVLMCDSEDVDVCPTVMPTDVGSATVTVTIYIYI